VAVAEQTSESSNGSGPVVVTGGNRGLGLEVCRQLAQAGVAVCLACRDTHEGEQAAGVINASAPGDVRVYELDVTDARSVERLALYLRADWERITGIVHHASSVSASDDPKAVRRMLSVNVFGALRVTDELLPLLGDHGSVVMVSCESGALSVFGPEQSSALSDPALTRNGLVTLVKRYLADLRAGRAVEAGWPSSPYQVSKGLFNAVTRILAAELAHADIHVNAVCPPSSPSSDPDEATEESMRAAAQMIHWAARLTAGGPTGVLIGEGRYIPW
jgi:NAD(P)-dependent dehydrogenase (short-subunit alcohol dehydrogenase family)